MSATRTYEHKHTPQTETLHQAGAELRSAPPRLVTERSRQRSSPPVPQNAPANNRRRCPAEGSDTTAARPRRLHSAPELTAASGKGRAHRGAGARRKRPLHRGQRAKEGKGRAAAAVRPRPVTCAAPAGNKRDARRGGGGEKPRRALTCAPAAPRLLAPPPPPPSGGTTCRITPGGQIAASLLLMPRAFEASTAEPPACFPEGHRQSLGAGEKRFRSSGFPPPSPGFAPSWSRPVEAARLCLSSEVGLRPRGLLLP